MGTLMLAWGRGAGHMTNTLADFDTSLARARSIMRVADVSHKRRDLSEFSSHLGQRPGKAWRRVDGKVVGTVDGVVGSHSKTNAQFTEHFVSSRQTFHRSAFGWPMRDVDHRFSDASGNDSIFADCKEVAVEHGPVRSGNQIGFASMHDPIGKKLGKIDLLSIGSAIDNVSGLANGADSSAFHLADISRKWHPIQLSARSGGPSGKQWPLFSGQTEGYLLDIPVPVELESANRGTNAHVIEALDDDVGTGFKVGFVPSVFQPFQGGHVGLGFLHETVEQKLAGFIGNWDNVNLVHDGRLADHSPDIEMACPHCGQRFLSNGWTGFTPIYNDRYGERTWVCPGCQSDMKEVANRPVRQENFAGSSGDLSQPIRQWPIQSAVDDWFEPDTEPCPKCQGSGSLNGQKCFLCWGTGKALPQSTSTPLSPPGWGNRSMPSWDWNKTLNAIHDLPDRHGAVTMRHNLWWSPKPHVQPGTRDYEDAWGRGLVTPQGQIYTWPEMEMMHLDRARSLGIPDDPTRQFTIDPTGKFRVTTPFHSDIPWYIQQETGLEPQQQPWNPDLFGYKDVLGAQVGVRTWKQQPP